MTSTLSSLLHSSRIRSVDRQSSNLSGSNTKLQRAVIKCKKQSLPNRYSAL